MADDRAKSALVVGGDGVLGRALTAALVARGWSVRATTRRRARVTAERPYLDLDSRAPARADARLAVAMEVAFLCAAVTSDRACRADPAASRRINVERSVDLAQRLVEAGVRVVYPSTNLVLDDLLPFAEADRVYHPRSEYARQKAEAERRLLASDVRCSVLRLSKVLQTGHPLIGGWIAALRAGRSIRPWRDMVMAPVPLDLAIEALIRMATRRADGVLQLSGDRDISYAEAAARLAEILGADPALVQPASAADAADGPPWRPRHTTLDMRRTIEILGIRPANVWQVLEALVNDVG